MRMIWPIEAIEWVWDWAHESGRYVLPNNIAIPTEFGCVEIEAGYMFDGASWAPNGPHNEVMVAACVHDWLYAAKKFADGKPCTRKQADSVLYELMRKAGVTVFTCMLYYRAVRTVGWIPWNYYARLLQNGYTTTFFLSPSEWTFNGWEMSNAHRKDDQNAGHS